MDRDDELACGQSSEERAARLWGVEPDAAARFAVREVGASPAQTDLPPGAFLTRVLALEAAVRQADEVCHEWKNRREALLAALYRAQEEDIYGSPDGPDDGPEEEAAR